MFRLLIYGLVIYLGYKLWKSSGASLFKSDDEGGSDSEPPADTDLIKDPQCGTYFMKRRGVEAKVQGEWRYFCSQDCRDEYLRLHGRD